MKKLAILTFTALLSLACGQSAQTANANISVINSNDSAIVSSHSEVAVNSGNPETAANSSQDAIVSRSETKTMWKQSGTPIDVTSYNTAIAKAEKDLKAKPKDDEANKNLSEAYTARAVALTEARQYASALGDYRRALKYNAANEEAKGGRDVIISIYKSMNRESPAEGEEPPPLPFINPADIKPKATTDKITFEKGATSTVVTGDLTNYTDSKSFVISVKQGQTIRTEQIKDNNSLDYITVVMSDSTGKYVGDSDASCNNRKEIKPTAAGDYRVSVTECTKAEPWNGQFKLKISVE